MKYPEDCIPEVKTLIEKVVETTRREFDKHLLAISLHGSLAMGSYYFPKSDIDILIVVNSAIPPGIRRTYFELISEISDRRQTVGDIELTVLQQDALNHRNTCIPFEVHYSEEQKKKFRSLDFLQNNCDGDLSAHLMVAYHRGITLFGPHIKSLMAEPSWENYRQSVLDDLTWILSSQNILTTPFYSILNCCRAYLLLIKNENQVYSKEEGAIKAQQLLPNIGPQIQQALDAYQSSKAVVPQTRRTNDQEWKREDLIQVRDYFRALLKDERFKLNLTE